MRVSRRFLVLLLMGFAPGLTGLSSGCRFDPSGLSPFAERDGSTDGSLPDASGPCAAGAHRCQGALLQVCAAEAWQDETLCEWGCAAAPEAHCGIPRFSNGVDLDSDTGSEDVTFPDGITTIDTDSGVITLPGGSTLTTPYLSRHTPQTDGPGLRILGFRRVTIPNGAIVQVVGASALALVTREDLLISGRLEALGNRSGLPSAGGYPGGGAGSPGQGPGGGGPGQRDGYVSIARSGGGGAGHTDGGGSGGSAESYPNSAQGGAGGTALDAQQLSSPEPLVGGSGGGGGGDGGTGGSGGGALMLAAGGAVEIQAQGVVNAGGGGGAVSNSGGGGGGGGMVLIQCRAISIAGVLAANGGGGGGAGDEGVGSDGLASDSLTPGGGSHGGGGGAGDLMAGTPGTRRDTNGGGGGGAAGRLLLYSTAETVITGTGLVSPHEGTTGFSLGILPIE